MDMTSIATAQASIRSLLGIAKTATDAVVDHQLKERLIEVQQGILDIQAQLGDAQADRLAIMEEAQRLRDRVRELEAAKAKLDAYELVEVEEGKYLHRSIGHAVEHYACPNCFSAAKVAVLQRYKSGQQQVKYGCQVCSFLLFVGPSDPLKRQLISPGVGRFRDY